MLWNHDKEKLHGFLDNLNKFLDSIKFTWETSDEKATFLDTTIYKGSRLRQTGILDIQHILNQPINSNMSTTAPVTTNTSNKQ